MIWTWNWIVPSIQDLKSHLALSAIFHNFHKILLDCVRLAPISIFLHIMQRSQLKKSGVAMQLFRLGEFMVDGSSLSLKLKFWTDFPLGKKLLTQMFPTTAGCMQGWGWGRGAWGHWGRWGIKLALQLFLDPTSQPKMKEEEDNKLGSTVSLFRT